MAYETLLVSHPFEVATGFTPASSQASLYWTHKEKRDLNIVMKQLSRREFCAITAAVGATALSARHSLMAQPAVLQVSLAIDPATSLAKVPVDFMGLSYESGQLAYPAFFSVHNTQLIEIFRKLSPAGILRLGGN